MSFPLSVSCSVTGFSSDFISLNSGTSLPIISSVPPLAIWQAAITNTSFIGKVKEFESCEIFSSTIFSGFNSSNKSEKTPLSGPIK